MAFGNIDCAPPEGTAETVRILVIDDNPSIHADFRKVLDCAQVSPIDLLGREILGDLAGAPPLSLPTYHVDSTLQGDEGCKMVERALLDHKAYSIAFVDMRMPPGWDGLETIEKLWQIAPDLHIVLCTAYSDHTWDTIVNRLGCTDQLLILRKPYDSVEVRQICLSLTEKARLARLSLRHAERLEKMVEARTLRLQQATRDAQESAARLRQLAESIDDVFWIEDRAERTLIYVSSGFEKVWGKPAEELIAAPDRVWREAVHPDDLDIADEVLLGLGDELPAPAAFRTLHPDRGTRWIQVRLHRVADDPNRIVGVAQDITEYRLAQDQLRQAQKLEAIGQLAAGIAHEINTPTQFVTDNTRFLRDSFGDIQPGLALLRKLTQLCPNDQCETFAPLGDDVAAVIEAMDLDYLETEIPQAIQQTLEGLERITTIVRAMKDFSYIGDAEMGPADLNHAISSTLVVCRNEWKYVAEVDEDLADDLPPVPCFIAEINQVMLNLIVNAAHAVATRWADQGTRGKITVRTRREEDWVRISVADNGTGIASGHASRVFDPFFTTKEVGQGTGQGLAMAWHTIVEVHGGELSFDTEFGVGTTFHVRLPLTAKPLPEMAPR